MFVMLWSTLLLWHKPKTMSSHQRPLGRSTRRGFRSCWIRVLLRLWPLPQKHHRQTAARMATQTQTSTATRRKVTDKQIPLFNRVIIEYVKMLSCLLVRNCSSSPCVCARTWTGSGAWTYPSCGETSQEPRENASDQQNTQWPAQQGEDEICALFAHAFTDFWFGSDVNAKIHLS